MYCILAHRAAHASVKVCLHPRGTSSQMRCPRDGQGVPTFIAMIATMLKVALRIFTPCKYPRSYSIGLQASWTSLGWISQACQHHQRMIVRPHLQLFPRWNSVST